MLYFTGWLLSTHYLNKPRFCVDRSIASDCVVLYSSKPQEGY